MTIDAQTAAAQLAGLTPDQKRAINDQLSNNEDSDDDEFVAWQETQNRLTPEQARLVVGFRDQAMRDMSFELFPGFHF